MVLTKQKMTGSNSSIHCGGEFTQMNQDALLVIICPHPLHFANLNVEVNNASWKSLFTQLKEG